MEMAHSPLKVLEEDSVRCSLACDRLDTNLCKVTVELRVLESRSNTAAFSAHAFPLLDEMIVGY